jgi:hypothetical protein
MRWEYEDKIHCELWFFSGINFGGEKRVVRIHPYGGLQGDDVEPSQIKSVGIIGQPGIRVTFMTSATGTDWENTPWRCVQVLEGQTTEIRDGRPAIQIPDLDLYTSFDAVRVDPEFEEGFPEVASFAEGAESGGWTFGRTGRSSLKTNIRSIRVERIPGGALDDAEEHELHTVSKHTEAAAPEPTVSARKASQHVEIRHAPTTTVSKNTRLPKRTSMTPGSGRKGD